jgi:hypothetical protein
MLYLLIMSIQISRKLNKKCEMIQIVHKLFEFHIHTSNNENNENRIVGKRQRKKEISSEAINLIAIAIVKVV